MSGSASRTATLVAVAAWMALAAAGPCPGKSLGAFGTVYGIAERDALQEIEEKAKRVDWGKYFDKKKWEKKIRGYRPQNIRSLPAATKDRVRRVDPTYTLPFDIPDGKGGILYPAGYTFNPLDYIFLSRVLVVIDGGRREQVTWLKSLGYFRDMKTMVLLTGGNYYDLSKELRVPVYYLDDILAERLGIERVPSVAVQKGNRMEVSEYAVKKE